MLGAFAYDLAGWDGKQGYRTVTVAGAHDNAYFLTKEEAAAYCQTRGCSYAPVILNVDRGQFHDRLWNIRDSQILHYLGNFKQSRTNRKVYLWQFLARDG